MTPTITMRVALRADDLRPGMTIDAAERGDRPADGRPLVICDVERHMVDLDVWGRPPGVTTGKRWRVNFPDPRKETDRYPTEEEARKAWAALLDATGGLSDRVNAVGGTAFVKLDEAVEVTVDMPIVPGGVHVDPGGTAHDEF